MDEWCYWYRSTTLPSLLIRSDDYSLVFLSGCKGTTFLNPPNFRGINLLKVFKVDNKSPFTECGLW